MQPIREVRFAFRALRGAPVISIPAIACIGLGIGSVTTVYSTATAFTFRPLPQMHAAGELMLVAESPASDQSQGVRVTAATFADLRTLAASAGPRGARRSSGSSGSSGSRGSGGSGSGSGSAGRYGAGVIHGGQL